MYFHPMSAAQILGCKEYLIIFRLQQGKNLFLVFIVHEPGTGMKKLCVLLT